MRPRRTPPEPRFWNLVNRRGSKDCWEWNGWRNRKGYGSFADYTPQYGGTTRGAHRWAWIFTKGPIPKGLMVCHKCDNPPCCNPAHLFLGTNSDNQRDSWSKGRVNNRGENGRNLKLNALQVRVIRKMKGVVPGNQIARIFGVGNSQISRILNNQSWA